MVTSAANAVSSTVVSKRRSSASISSIRSIELSPSSSSVVAPVTSRPCAKCATTSSTVPPSAPSPSGAAASPAEVAVSPSTQRFTCARFSFWVPSVRGSDASGQTEKARIR